MVKYELRITGKKVKDHTQELDKKQQLMRFLSQESVVKLVVFCCCFVLSHLDRSISVLVRLPIESINKFQNVPKLGFSPRFRPRKHENITPALKKSQLAACLSTNPLQAVSSLLQELYYSLSFYLSDPLSPSTASRTLRSLRLI